MKKFLFRKGQVGQALRQAPSSALGYGGQAGQAALSLVLLVGGTIILIGATLTFLVLNFVNSTYGFQAANRALGVALSGANDALLQIIRDKEFPVASSGGCSHYNFSVGDSSAFVVVAKGYAGNPPYPGGVLACNNPGYSTDPNITTVVSQATVLGRSRRVIMRVSIGVNGEVGIASLKQEVYTGGPNGGIGS